MVSKCRFLISLSDSVVCTKMLSAALFLLLLGSFPACRAQVKILLVSEPTQQNMVSKFEAGIAKAEAANSGLVITVDMMKIDRENYDVQLNTSCDKLATATFNLVVDLTWGGWMAMKEMADNAGYPYLRMESGIGQFVQVGVTWEKLGERLKRASYQKVKCRNGIGICSIFKHSRRQKKKIRFPI
jgi:hypothetical protein